MRLKSISLSNFRCFAGEVIDFDEYTALVGANNAGKSAAIAAIDIFFRSNPKSIPISPDDFYKRQFDRELEIRLTFSDLGEDATAEFSHYARGGEVSFFIKSTMKDGLQRSSLHGARFANPTLAPFFEMATAADKKAFYLTLVDQLGLASWQNQTQAADELRKFEAQNPDQNEFIPSDDKAFGVEGPVPRLRKFIDFVYIPAVKDAGDEAVEARNSAFTRLIDRAVRAKLKIDERIAAIRQSAKAEIDAISSDHSEILGNLAERIEGEYRKFNSAESQLHLEWSEFEGKNLDVNLPPVRLEVSDDLIRNSISKFGHGTQRNYIMALLMVSATYDFTNLQTVIIACEEPELYQHPPQARILADALHTLASSQTQVVVATHSPYFVNAKSFENIRVIRRTPGLRSQSYDWSLDENSALIARAKGENPIDTRVARALLNQFLQPQMNEMFFSPGILFVEGEEDKAIINKYFYLSKKNQELLNAGVHFVPVSGKGNLINALAIARGFQIPFFAVFDGDMDTENGEGKDANIRLNKDILALLEHDGEGSNGEIEKTILGKNFCVWRDSIQTAFADVSNWHSARSETAAQFGWKASRLKKNAMVLEAAIERMHSSAPIVHLEELCSQILTCLGSQIAKNSAPLTTTS